MLGEPVVRAAVETGTHYVDTAGEQPFIKLVADRYDEAARAAEVAVIPAMGFDYVPGDLLCRVVARDHEPAETLDLAYAVSGFGATRGTLRSALEAMRGGDVVWEDGAWLPAGPGPLRASAVFPEPFGREVVAKYPCGEIVSVPRHTRVRTLRARIAVSGLGGRGRWRRSCRRSWPRWRRHHDRAEAQERRPRTMIARREALARARHRARSRSS